MKKHINNGELERWDDCDSCDRRKDCPDLKGMKNLDCEHEKILVIYECGGYK